LLRFGLATVVAPAAPAHAAPFSGGSLVVERIGNGTTTLSSSAAQISVLEVTTAGSLTQTIILPSGTSDPQTDSGSATSNGYLNTYGGFVSVPGYNNAAGTASVVVTTPGGTNSANTLFAYVTPAPTVTGVSPASGSTLGGSNVTIDGISLGERSGAANIKFEEYRDDRYVAAIELWGGSAAQLFYLVRAVSPGDFVVPPPVIEDMYRPELRAVGTAVPERVTVAR
jgi:hypothetical protein